MSELWDIPLVRLFVALAIVTVAELLWWLFGRYDVETLPVVERERLWMPSETHKGCLVIFEESSIIYDFPAKGSEHYHPLNLPPKGPDPKQSVVFREIRY